MSPRVYEDYCDMAFDAKTLPPKDFDLKKACPRCGADGYLCDNGYQSEDGSSPCVIWIKDGKLKGRDLICTSEGDAEMAFLDPTFGCGYD